MFVQIKGTNTYYDIFGDSGSPVVLLHGWGCSGSMMKSTADALQAYHRVLVPDFPGFGQSSPPDSPWGVPEYAQWLREIITCLGLPPCAVVGHSFGCRVAAWTAAEWPELFTRMVFTGAAGLKKTPSAQEQKRARSFQRKKKIVKALGRIPGMKSAGQKMEETLRKKYGSADYNALDTDMRKTFVKVVNLDLRDCYPRIHQSTLLIWGDADTETPLWMGEKMEQLIPDAGLVILEGGSHFAYLEQNARFNTIVQHFLTEG